MRPEPLQPTDPLARFVEDVASFMAFRGLPRMAGRLWATLLVADPPQMTAAELVTSVHASAGSVSTMTRLLVSLNLVQRIRRPGERADRFWIPPEAVTAVLATQMGAVRTARELFDRGIDALANKPPPAQARVRELRDMWAFWERELPALTERWVESRKESAGNGDRHPDGGAD